MKGRIRPKTILDILKQLKDRPGNGNADSSDLSSSDLDEMLKRLDEVKKEIREREKAEKREQIKREAEEEEERRRSEEERRRSEEEVHIQEVACMDLPLDWENVFDTDERTSGVHTDSIPDALVMCLNTLGRVDIEYISSVTGADYKDVITALKGAIYQNPLSWDECFYKGWETKDEYLSGNLVRKWRIAKKADVKYKGYFRENLSAIEAALPKSVAREDIYVTLGSPWVPADIIDDFIDHMYKEKLTRAYYPGVKHDEITGSWEVPYKSRYKYDRADRITFGTPRIGALHILEKTLNMKTVEVMDEVKSQTTKSGKAKVLNKEETLLAIEKQKKMTEEFRKWIWQDEKRRERLEGIYEEKYACNKARIFDGSFLEFPGMSSEETLYPYQKNAVARMLFTKNTLLAHEVGSGKTFEMIAAGMEMRRMGLSAKNLYVVPNNITGQWTDIFARLYPGANVLTVEPNSFTPKKRGAMLEKIKNGTFDGIIMAYSCFERIKLSLDYYLKSVSEKLENIRSILQDYEQRKGRGTKYLEALKKKLSEQVVKMEAGIGLVEDGEIFFDELGITAIFVDEAHNFKNVPIETKVSRVLGINSKGSVKCQEMLDKIRHVQKNDGRVVLATGTPVTNSVTDAYVMQMYLQHGELKLLDLGHFDSWIGMFAEKVTEFEIDVDTSCYKLATRFSRFHNLPELTTLLAQIADFHQADDAAELPAFDGYSDALVSKSAAFKEYLDEISERAEKVRNRQVPRYEDNLLKITIDGRLAALDLRLVDPQASFTYQSKVARCAENVYDIYTKTMDAKCTQLVFCDSSTPKSGFNIYDEMRRLLMDMGIPGEEIAFVHDAGTEKKRSELFGNVQDGEVRVLLGSTFKLGLGVNVQDRLIAVHHLDVPWRPADMIQREGRILRQGNTNEKIYIYRYITEGSFDAYSWQLLETKQRFITALLSGSYIERSGTDIEDTVLDYAEVKALAVGNPLLKERVETANELNRLMMLQKKATERYESLEAELSLLPGGIRAQEVRIGKAVKDKAWIEEYYMENPLPEAGKKKGEEENGDGADRVEEAECLSDGKADGADNIDTANSRGDTDSTDDPGSTGSTGSTDSIDSIESIESTKIEKTYRKFSKEELEEYNAVRKDLRERLFNAVRAHELQSGEITFGEYKGFQIVIPSGVRREKPYVWLQREGRYYVELGDSVIGGLIRIDNFLEGFVRYIHELEKTRDEKVKRKEDIEKSLEERDTYREEIQALELKLKDIDERLKPREK